MLAFYQGKLGLFEDAVDVKAAAALIGCDVAVLSKTLQSYKEACMAGQCPDTGKDVFPSLISQESKNLILARVTPSIHYTMGGVNINAGTTTCTEDHSMLGVFFVLSYARSH
jgi:succinate dehydrogenase/fumarate reductase flavoprotein subunit